MSLFSTRQISTAVLSTFFLTTFTSLTRAQEDHPWFDASQPFEQRIEPLIEAMTLDEKVSQLMNDSRPIERLGIEGYNWWSEALHGVARSAKATVFPQAIGMASTFDPVLLQDIGTAISDEARAINNDLVARNGKYIQYMGLSFWSPNVNIFRDPRWGRGQETYGEDPLLSGTLGAAFIRGMQGDDPKYLKTAACAKHFAVHSGPEADRHHFDAIASNKDLYETYLPAFKLCVDAGVEAVMCAYNRTNGEACCGSNTLLIKILREQMGFNGHIVSDCGAIWDIHENHKITTSAEESAALAVKSGVDINCGGVYWALKGAVEYGMVTEKEIDARLRKVLMTRFRLGLFDSPEINPYSKIPTSVINSSEHRALAREAAEKSIVLLQNKNNVLPLKKDIPFVYLGGPLMADIRALLGNYNGLSGNMVTLLEGVTSKVSPSTRVQFFTGGLLSEPNSNPIDWFSGEAKSADATIVGLGFSVLLEGEEGEAIASDTKGDNLNMRLPEPQLAYLRKIAETDKPVIAVIFAGCPVDLTEISELADAVIYAWYPGEEGGNAIADIIFGDTSPSGKLPITFPRSLDDLPPYDDYSMRGRTYKYMTKEPFYPFGYGLSYGKLDIGEIEVNKNNSGDSKSYRISAPVTNDGTMNAEEVVQLYVSLLQTDSVVPQAELKQFKRVALAAGASDKVTFDLSSDDIFYIKSTGHKAPYQGRVKITIGNASPGKRSEELGATLQSTVIEIN